MGSGYNSASARVVDGPLVLVSGQVPLAADGTIADGDVAGQTRQVFRNIAGALAEHGAEPSHLVKLTYYLRHIDDLNMVRLVHDEFVTWRPAPASTVVEVRGLEDPRYLLAVDAVAALPAR